jgi:hypothetical protein
MYPHLSGKDTIIEKPAEKGRKWVVSWFEFSNMSHKDTKITKHLLLIGFLSVLCVFVGKIAKLKHYQEMRFFGLEGDPVL